MTNELTKDAEESTPTEKTATEQPETNNEATATAAAEATETPASEPPTVTDDAAGEPAVETAAMADAAGEPAVESAATADASATAGDSTTPEPATESTATAETPVSTAPPVRPPNRVVMAPKRPFEQAPAVEETPAAEVSPAVVKPTPPEDPHTTGDVDFGAILEQFEQAQKVFHAGELVEGKVVGITERGVLVDFGYKSEGFVPPEEFTGPNGEMMAAVGDDVEVIIRNITGDGAPQLSRVDALGRKVWDDIEAAFNSETPITGKVVDKTKGGLRIDLNGIEAFLPGSQIDSRPIRGLDSYIGQDIEAKIIKFSRRRNNIVLSRKVLTDAVVNVQKAETLGRIEIGYIIDGTIKNLTEYGAFVDIGGLDGLLHVTDMSWGRLNHPSDAFKVGEPIQIKVLKLDKAKEKISLGYKQLLPDPWSTVVEVYPVNSKIEGTVSSVTDYGVFVELEPGVEGLVHVSEISWARRAQSPKRMFSKNQKVEVQVLGVDTVEKRISLGMKQFQENPWDMVDIKFPVGSRVQGRVRNLTDFGAFVELEDGIDGLVHVSDITWAKKIKHPKDVLKKDQEVEAIVTSIDKRGQRLSLSMKDLTPSAWEGFVATHKPGDVVRGKVSRFTNFGVFVELGEGLEGLCHISELSDERVECAESVAELGQEMDFKILRIEPSEQKIGLSHRSVGKEDEPVADTKMYSTEAKGGMASLGELAKLRGTEEAAPVEDPEAKKRAKQAAKKAKAEEFAAREAEAAAEAEKAAAAEEAPAESAPEVAEAHAAETEASVAEIAEPAAETTEAESEAAAEETPAAEAASKETTVAETEAKPESASEESPAEEASTEEISVLETEAKSEAATEETPVAEAAAEETTVAETEAESVAATEETPVVEASTEETPAAKTEAESEAVAEETPVAEAAEPVAETTEAEPESVPEEVPAAESVIEETATDEPEAEAEKKSAKANKES